MDSLTAFARGPLFYFSLAVFVLGLVRHLILRIWWRPREPWDGCSFREGGLWLAPLRALFLSGMVLVPLFHEGHVRLWERGLGWRWPSLGEPLAGHLTIATVILGLVLLGARIAIPRLRASRHLDMWLIPPLVSMAFASGYLMAHPAWYPLSPRPLELLHVLCGEALLIWLPFSCALARITRPLGRLRNHAKEPTS